LGRVRFFGNDVGDLGGGVVRCGAGDVRVVVDGYGVVDVGVAVFGKDVGVSVVGYDGVGSSVVRDAVVGDEVGDVGVGDVGIGIGGYLRFEECL
jgi:hypothetical protein